VRDPPDFGGAQVGGHGVEIEARAGRTGRLVVPGETAKIGR